MIRTPLSVSPLALNQLTRDYWGQYDATAIAQLAAFADDPCYRMKFYKAPGDDQELMAAYGYVNYGLAIRPGSIIFGFYLPMVQAPGSTYNSTNPLASGPGQFTVQITDNSLQHKFWDEPVASLFVSNFKPTFQSQHTVDMGSFPNLLCAPHPVVGSGLFDVEIQETSGVAQRIELVLGVLEVCSVD